MHWNLGLPALVLAAFLSIATSAIVGGDEGPVFYAPMAPSLYRNYTDAPKLHFAVISIPLWGHLQSLLAIAEELAHRGHHITVFVERSEWCARLPAGRGLRIDCVGMPAHPDLFTATSLSEMSRASSILGTFAMLFADMFAHHRETLPEYIDAVAAVQAVSPITTFLCDSTTFACASVARLLDVPVVHTLPFTLQLNVGRGLAGYLPGIGTGFPRHMSLPQRMANFGLKFVAAAANSIVVANLNRVRRTWGVPLVCNGFDACGLYDTIITPSLWGLDIPQPLCPNVHPVGALLQRQDRLPALQTPVVDTALRTFLDECEQGVLYVNFGSLSVPTPEMYLRLVTGLRRLPFCIALKMNNASQKQLRSDLAATEQSDVLERVFLSNWFDSSMAILKHPNVFLFISHCGGVSVMEGLEAGVTTVGLPMFADQADVCQRVEEAGIGRTLGHKHRFTALDVEAAVWDTVRNHDHYAGRISRLKRTVEFLGGSAEAASLIELRQHNLLLRRNTSMERCAMLDDSNTAIWLFHTGFYTQCLFLVASVVLCYLPIAWAMGRLAYAMRWARWTHETVILRRASKPVAFTVVPRSYKEGGGWG